MNGREELAAMRARAETAEKWSFLYFCAVVILTLTASLAVSGCGTKTVIVPDGQPVRIREATVVPVWVRGADGAWVESETVLPVGWFAGPPPSK